MKKYSLLLIVLFVIQLLNVKAQSITPEIIADLKQVVEVVVSPAGNQIAYLLRVPGEDASGMQQSVLMTIPITGGDPKVVLGKKNNPSSISWSNDGKIIYCLMKDTATKFAQVYSVQPETYNVNAITREKKSVKRYSFSRDGKSLALIYTDGKTEEEIANEKIRHDWEVKGENQKFDRLYITDATATSPAKILSDKTLHVTDFVWSSDSKSLFYKASINNSMDWTMMYQKIYKVSSEGGMSNVVCKTEGKLGNLSISPDSKMLAFCSAVDISDPLAQSVFVVPVDGGEPKNLTPSYEGSAVEVEWVNPSTIIMLAAEGCYTSLKKIDIKTGKVAVVYEKGAIIRSMSLIEKGGAMALSASTPASPNELYAGTIVGGFKKLTTSNPQLKSITLTKQEVVSWTGPDNWQIEGVLTYPKDYVAGTKYPLLLQVHGGPEGISFNGWNTRGVYPAQLYAANGFFILEPNYRGSQGRGVAFAKGDHKDLAGKEFDDIMAGVDMLVSKGMVDKNKVGTGGFSYGGYFAAWAATKLSDRFKAVVMGAGISNWISFSGTTDIIHENSHVHWNLWWPDKMDLVWDRSPLAHINNAKTPMLIIHGDADTRVPITQSEEMYQALKLKNVPVQFTIYKRQPHGIIEREAQIDYMNRTLKWFKEYVK